MALQQDELFSETAGLGSGPRFIPGSIQPKRFAAGSGTIPKHSLVAAKNATTFWEAFDSEAGTDQINVLTADGTPASAGTFNLSVDGETTEPIAFDADAADVVAALEALQGIAVGDVVGVDTVATDLGDANHVVTLTWGGKLKGTPLTVSADQTLISAGNDFVLTVPTPGVLGNALNVAQGFAWPDDIVLNAAGEILRTVMLSGRVHRDDVALNGQSQAVVDAALVALRTKGFTIEGLEAFGS